LNQNSLYSIQQPRQALDVGLFRDWENHLTKSGVKIRLGEDVESMLDHHTINLRNGEVITAQNVYFAIPPEHMVKVLNKSFDPNMFGNFSELKRWSTKTRYLDYVPITFHWNEKINIQEKWGYPQFDWGLATVVLSDFFDKGQESPTLISTCLSILDKKSSLTAKTANQTIDHQELIDETFRQLKLLYPNLPMYNKAILSPGVYHDGKSYRTKDSAFMFTKDGYWKEPSKYSNIKWIGIHEGNSPYAFTAMQSAFDNALVSLGKKVKRPWTIIDVIIISILFIVVGVFSWKYGSNKN